MTFLLILVLIVSALAALCSILLLRKMASANAAPDAALEVAGRLTTLEQSLSQKLTGATTDIACRLEQTKGDLRQQVTDRLEQGFDKIRSSVEGQLADGRREQSLGLAEARQELTNSLTSTTMQLKAEFDSLTMKTMQSLDGIRDQVDAKLLAITDQVQQKLDQNIKEGFAHFEKVQQHLKNAEEQLRQVGVLGNSINDLNTLLKLPHMRGQFGEASLERLLSDFLPANMYDLQSSPGEGQGRADVMINFPNRRLPVDAKFPREQIIALFESSDPVEIEEARQKFVRVMKTEAKRIRAYIQPENGTTEIALMYLPSETLYLEAVRNRELADWLNQQHVFPVSPNTLLMTLHTIALVHKWFEVATRFEKSRQELAKAQKSFDYFQTQFDNVGKNLNKAQEAFDTASKHLKTYRGRVSVLSGQEQLGLETPPEEILPIADKASA